MKTIFHVSKKITDVYLDGNIFTINKKLNIRYSNYRLIGCEIIIDGINTMFHNYDDLCGVIFKIKDKYGIVLPSCAVVEDENTTIIKSSSILFIVNGDTKNYDELTSIDKESLFESTKL